jgi:energy-coupling factor transporter ATP-binding protein EcfA2
VSARRGAGVRELAKSIDSWRRGSNVYLVGCTNTGKSTLVNALQGAFGGSRGRLITAGVVAVRGDQKTNSHDKHQHQQEQQEPQETDDGGPFENADSRNDDDSDFQSRRQAPQTLTTSHVPGTTAHVVAVPVLSVPVGSRAVLHDTPGVSTHGKRVTDHLSSRDVLTAMASGERTLTGRGGGFGDRICVQLSIVLVFFFFFCNIRQC